MTEWTGIDGPHTVVMCSRLYMRQLQRLALFIPWWLYITETERLPNECGRIYSSRLVRDPALKSTAR